MNWGVLYAAVAAFFGSTCAAQLVVYVAPCGNDSNVGATPDCNAGGSGPLRTIQTAINRINASGLDGIVNVAPGVWHEWLEVPGGNITIQSLVDGSQVLVSPPLGNMGRVLRRTAEAGETLTLTDIVVAGGLTNGNGGGIQVLGGNLTMTSCTVERCKATWDGGGIYFSGGVLTMTGCVVKDNRAGTDGSTHHGGGLCTGVYDYVTLQQCTFLQNWARDGAHLYLSESGSLTPNTISDCEFRGAWSGWSGVSSVGLLNNFTNFNGCTFVENSVNNGYCLVMQDANVRMTGGSMRSNDGGGSIRMLASTLTCQGVEFVGNEGTAVYGQSGAGMHFDRCRFDAAGITQVMVDCSAGGGKGSNCLFKGGAYAFRGEDFTLDRCTFVGQTGAPLAFAFDTLVTNSIVWGQVSGPLNSPSLAVASSIVDHIDQWPAGDRVWMIDPLLDSELRPRAGSWAIDAADPSLLLGDFADADGDGITNEPAPFDLAGNPRVHDDTGLPDQLGYASDLGALEFQGTTCLADFDGDGFVTGADYDQYVQAFEAGDAYADFDRDGFLTGVDFDLYSGRYEEGC